MNIQVLVGSKVVYPVVDWDAIAPSLVMHYSHSVASDAYSKLLAGRTVTLGEMVLRRLVS